MNDPEFRKKIFTPERNKKLSKALTGLKKSNDHVGKLPQNRVGFKHKKEFGEKIAKAMMGNKYALGLHHSEETKRILADHSRGNKHTLGRVVPYREKLAKSLTLRNKSKSNEHRGNISEALKKSWEDRRAKGVVRANALKIIWPHMEVLSKKLEVMTIKKLATELGVKVGTLSAFLWRKRKEHSCQ